MKLALAIAVCVYLRAVIAAVDVGDLEFQRFLEFVDDDPKYQAFPQTVNGDPKYKDFHQIVNSDPKYKDFDQTLNVHFRFKNILKRFNDHEELLTFSSDDHNMGETLLNQLSVKFYEDMNKYMIMRGNYQTFKRNGGINFGTSDENWEKIKANHELYKMFLKDVDVKFEDFLKSATDPPFEEQLIKADLDFKLKCILAFRNAGDSSSSTRTTRGGTSNIAYDIFAKQLGIGDLEFQRILAFVNGDPEYQAFPQTVNDNPLYKEFLQNKKEYEQMGKKKRALSSFHSNDDGHQKCLDFFDFINGDPNYKNSPQTHSTIRSFYSDKLKYMIMRRNYERFEGRHRYKKILVDSPRCESRILYKKFLDDVDVKFKDFLKSAKDPHFEEELIKVDLDIKLKCILAFRNAGDSSSSTRTTCWGTSNIANDILKEQSEIFINDLMDDVVSAFDWDAKAKFKKISKRERDSLRFFGRWFATDWNNHFFETKIRNMKETHRLNNKEAKIMILLQMFK